MPIPAHQRHTTAPLAFSFHQIHTAVIRFIDNLKIFFAASLAAWSVTASVIHSTVNTPFFG